jgi:uncharacterized metal-binding protein
MTKSKPQIKIVNCETGEEIIQDADDNFVEQLKKDNAEMLERKAIIEAKAAQRQAILDRLGLTSDEVKLLLG